MCENDIEFVKDQRIIREESQIVLPYTLRLGRSILEFPTENSEGNEEKLIYYYEICKSDKEIFLQIWSIAKG